MVLKTEFMGVLRPSPKASLDRTAPYEVECRGTGIRRLVLTATAPYDVAVSRKGNPTASRDRTRTAPHTSPTDCVPRPSARGFAARSFGDLPPVGLPACAPHPLSEHALTSLRSLDSRLRRSSTRTPSGRPRPAHEDLARYLLAVLRTRSRARATAVAGSSEARIERDATIRERLEQRTANTVSREQGAPRKRTA